VYYMHEFCHVLISGSQSVSLGAVNQLGFVNEGISLFCHSFKSVLKDQTHPSRNIM